MTHLETRPSSPAADTPPTPDIRDHPTESPLVDLMHALARREIRVHEHGFIALLDVMPRLVPEGRTADAAIVQAARVSYGHGTKRVNEDRGLIRYLMRHRHTTPFEMVEFKFHVAMPIFIARQWIRHRTASVNEYSGRYSIIPDHFYRPSPDAVRKQSRSNRQGGSETFTPPHPPAGGEQGGGQNASQWASGPGQKSSDEEAPPSSAPPAPPPSEAATVRDFLALLDRAESLHPDYERLLDAGVSRELARIALPLSTYTQWYWKCDLHNILHFLKLRLDPHAQEEIRLYARAMLALIEPVVPLTIEAFRDYELDSVRLSALEVEALRRILSGGTDARIDTENRREQREWEQKLARLR